MTTNTCAARIVRAVLVALALTCGGETHVSARTTDAPDYAIPSGWFFTEALPYPPGLSEREVEVLRLVAAGRSNPEIAAVLVLSRNTVQRHLSNILGKAGLTNRAEAAAYAQRHNLV